ncbi:MAG: nucleoside phosphorylase [Kineosporiaceae bacterium]
MELPLLEDDRHERGVIEPSREIAPVDMPEAVVLCFFGDVVSTVSARPDAVRRLGLRWEHGEHALYEVPVEGRRLGVLQLGVGAPVAAGLLEELIASGGRTFVAVGGAGALVPDLALGHALVVRAALRDEGTSLHYLPPSRVIEADPEGIAVLESVLADEGVPSRSVLTWTTDAPYRETRSRVDRRVAEGCEAVEMEAAALLAVARFRQVRMAHLLYAGDCLAGAEWDERDWTTATAVRHRLFDVAARACLAWSEAVAPSVDVRHAPAAQLTLPEEPQPSVSVGP